MKNLSEINCKNTKLSKQTSVLKSSVTYKILVKYLEIMLDF